jgi:hypothetical protein
MKGGFLQLVARNRVDLYLIGTPDITFFKTVYRRHTNFTIEDQELKFKGGNLNFGKLSQCKIETHGDMIHKLNLVTQLPEININYKKLTINNVIKLLNKYNIRWKQNQNENQDSLLTNIQFLQINQLINDTIENINSDYEEVNNKINSLANIDRDKNSITDYFINVSNVLLENSEYKFLFNFIIAHQNTYSFNNNDELLTNEEEIRFSIFSDYQRSAILRAGAESNFSTFPLLSTLSTTFDEAIQVMTLFDSIQTDIEETVDVSTFYQIFFNNFYKFDTLENYKKLDSYKFYQLYINNNPQTISTKAELIEIKNFIINLINCSIYESFRLSADIFINFVKEDKYQITYSNNFTPSTFSYFDPLLPSSIEDTEHIKFLNYSETPYQNYNDGTIQCDNIHSFNFKLDYTKIASQELGIKNENFLNSNIFKPYFNDPNLWIGYDINTILFNYIQSNQNIDNIVEKFNKLDNTVILNGIINITIDDIGKALLFYIEEILNKNNSTIENEIDILKTKLYGFNNFNTSLLDRVLPTNNIIDSVINSRQEIKEQFQFLFILNPKGDFINNQLLNDLVSDSNRSYNAYELLQASYYKLLNTTINNTGLFSEDEISNMKNIIDMFFTDDLISYDEYVQNGFTLYNQNQNQNKDQNIFNFSSPLFGDLQSSIARLIYLNQRENYNNYCNQILNNISTNVTNGTNLDDFIDEIQTTQLSSILKNNQYDYFALREYNYIDNNNQISNYRVANFNNEPTQYITNINLSLTTFLNTYYYYSSNYPWSFFIDINQTLSDSIKAERDLLIDLLDFSLEKRNFFYNSYDLIIAQYENFLSSRSNLSLTFFNEVFSYLLVPKIINNIPQLVIQPITTSSNIRSSTQLKGLSKCAIDTLLTDQNSIINIFNKLYDNQNPFDILNEKNLYDLYITFNSFSSEQKIKEEDLLTIIKSLTSENLWLNNNSIEREYNNFKLESNIYKYIIDTIINDSDIQQLLNVNRISNIYIYEQINDRLIEDKRIIENKLENITNDTLFVFNNNLTNDQKETIDYFIKNNYRLDFNNILISYGIKEALIQTNQIYKLDINNQLQEYNDLIKNGISLDELLLFYKEINLFFEISKTNPLDNVINYEDAESLGDALLGEQARSFYIRINEQFFSIKWNIVYLKLQINNIDTSLLYILSKYETLDTITKNYYNNNFETYFTLFYNTIKTKFIINEYNLNNNFSEYFLSQKSLLMNLIIRALNNETPHFAWIKNIGFYMIDYINLSIDDQIIDTQTGEWLYLLSQLTRNPKKTRGINNMIGNKEDLINFNQNKKNSYTLYTQLQFWFSKFYELSLPLIALNHCNVQINVKIREFEELCYYDDFTEFKFIPKLQGKLLTQYITLDSVERKQIAKKKQEQLIETVQITKSFSIGFDDVDQERKYTKRIYFQNSIKEFIWIYENKRNVNGSLKNKERIYNKYGDDKNLDINVEIFLNGRYRESQKENKFYNLVNSHKYHNSIPQKGINVYSFSLQPEKLQPSGTLNTSMIEFVDFEFQLGKELLEHMKENKIRYTIRLYGLGYNILRIMSGLAGLAFNEN